MLAVNEWRLVEVSMNMQVEYLEVVGRVDTAKQVGNGLLCISASMGSKLSSQVLRK